MAFSKWEPGVYILNFETGSEILGPVLFFFFFFFGIPFIYLVLSSDIDYHFILGLFKISFRTYICNYWCGKKMLAREDFKPEK